MSVSVSNSGHVNVQQQDRLCSRCEELDILSLFAGDRYAEGLEERRKPAQYNSHKIRFQTLDHIIENACCPFCRLVRFAIYEASTFGISSPMPVTSTDPAQITCYLVPWRADNIERYSFVDQDTASESIATALEILLDPALARTDSDQFKDQRWLFAPHIKPIGSIHALHGRGLLCANRDIGFRLSEDVNQWLQECILEHDDCAITPTVTDQGVDLPPFTVIDVNDRTLMTTSVKDCSFVALSYVYGDQTRDWIDGISIHFEAHSPYLPDSLPKTVADAIEVCRILNFQYLWVDSLCIDASNHGVRQSQIMAMDEVYCRAQVVLIALASQNMDDGLLQPDWTSKRSYRRHRETVDGYELTTCFPSMSDELVRSNWKRRGWTMQEALLARRCIVFSAKDVTFICRRGLRRTADDWSSLRTSDTNCGSRFKLYAAMVLPSNTEHLNSRNWSFARYDDIIRDYTTRRFSHDSDVLNAISGYLSLVTKATGVVFVHGLPTRDFPFALLWDDVFEERRVDFPSWTWAGWRGIQQGFWIHPRGDEDSSATCLVNTGNVASRCRSFAGPLFNAFVTGSLLSHRWSESLAEISISSGLESIHIISEAVHFDVSIRPKHAITDSDILSRFEWKPTLDNASRYSYLPDEFDSSISDLNEIDASAHYTIANPRLCMIDEQGNTYYSPWIRAHDSVCPLRLNLPFPISGQHLLRILRDGVRLVRVLEIRKTDAEGQKADGVKPLHFVACLQVLETERGLERWGSAYMLKDVWNAAGPTPCEVEVS